MLALLAAAPLLLCYLLLFFLGAQKTANKQSEVASFLEERVRMLEKEAAGSVPAAILVGSEQALAEATAKVQCF